MMKTDDLAALLETLCPMFVLVDDTGCIKQVGPTLQKLRPDQPMAGQGFLSLFELVRPAHGDDGTGADGHFGWAPAPQVPG